MQPLKALLTAKIVFTALFWSLPSLFFPESAARLLHIPSPQPALFVRLLGAAFLALLVGYVLGLRDLGRGKEIRNTVWVGIVSNGLAFLILIIFAGQWNGWSARAALFLWLSTAGTFLITLGLIVFGVMLRKHPRPGEVDL